MSPFLSNVIIIVVSVPGKYGVPDTSPVLERVRPGTIIPNPDEPEPNINKNQLLWWDTIKS